MQRVRPLPGIAFRAETPITVTLPRMDVSGFVGFAARGPINTPVVVEDYPRLEDIFGGIYPLAWDDETATQQTACLAPVVKAFFAQGGRRCWVVRVAGTQAVANQFPISGLLRTDVAGYQAVVAKARSEGSWSDGLQVSAGLLLEPLIFQAGAAQPGAAFTLDTARLQGQPVSPGDLLQIDCADGIHRAYVALQAEDLSNHDGLLRVIVRPERAFWFRRVSAGLTGTVQTVSPAPAGSAPGTLSVNAESLTLQTTLDAMSGDYLRMETAMGRAWLLVADARGGELLIASAWLENHDPTVPVLTIALVRRVQMSLQARDDSDFYATLSDLACAAPHPRFIGNLPDDATLFAPRSGLTEIDALELWDAVRHPRFPLSFGIDSSTVIVPLGLETAPAWQGALTTTQESLVRDGLVPEVSDYHALTHADWASFIADLHLEEALRFTGQYALMSEASDLMYLQNRRLSGLHALLPIDEISMIAMPDAAQRGWLLTQRQTETLKPPSEPEPSPDPCAVESPFEDCAPEPEEPEEEGPSAEALPEIMQGAVWQLLAPAGYDVSALLEVQKLAAMLAAARGDMITVLGMPKHYRTADALQYQRQLAAALQLAGETTDSYATLYHPWVIAREDNGDLLHTHPAGVACGVLAARSLARGAWVAPANETLRGSLAVIPAPRPGEEAALYRVGINLVRQMAQGFTIWGAHTQSADYGLEQINVRRLLILLRRLALREGQSYVFAPHSAAFRGRVKQQFEQVLSRLFAQGAFAGSGPSEAYRVVIDETLNTQASIEQGRLIVELRVAPSQPMTFITVRLVQAESGLLAVQEVTANG